MDTALITKRLDILDQNYRDFISGEFVSITTDFFAEKLQLTEVQKNVFENGLMIYLLLFFSKYQLVQFLIDECSLNIKTAMLVVNTIEKGVPSELLKSANEARNKLLADMTPVKDRDRLTILDTSTYQVLYMYLLAKTYGLNETSTSLNLDELATDKLKDTVGDIILGFYNIADTEPLLIQELGITPEAAQDLTPNILEFLAPLSDPNWQPPVEEIPNYQTNEVTIVPDANAEQAAEVEGVSEIHTTAQPMRTMQQDMARSPQRSEFEPMTDETPIYTSEQPTNEHDVPSYTQPKQTSRWDSEQE